MTTYVAVNILVFLCVCSRLLQCECRRKTYIGDQVVRITPHNDKEVKFLNDLVANSTDLDLDFWKFPGAPEMPVDVHIPRGQIHRFKGMLKDRHMRYITRVRNLQRLVNMERMRPRAGGFDSKFHDYHKIVKELHRLQNHSRDLASVIYLGNSSDGIKMYAIKITRNVTLNSTKPIVFINCGIHAREWISIATCMYLARKMVLTYPRDRQLRKVVDRLEWIFMPVVNVDGYIYTRKRDRLWRKNRVPMTRGCTGTDLNRNFNFKWGGIGSNVDNPCSQIYAGKRPFSEVETKNLASYLYSIRHRLKGYIDFHSYGQLWMCPWGYKKELPPRYHKLQIAMNHIVTYISYVHGTRFHYGPASILIYPTTGDATDWVFGVLGVEHSYGVELRPTMRSLNGFILPPSNIILAGKETLNGLLALSSFIR